MWGDLGNPVRRQFLPHPVPSPTSPAPECRDERVDGYGGTDTGGRVRVDGYGWTGTGVGTGHGLGWTGTCGRVRGTGVGGRVRVDGCGWMLRYHRRWLGGCRVSGVSVFRMCVTRVSIEDVSVCLDVRVYVGPRDWGRVWGS